MYKTQSCYQFMVLFEETEICPVRVLQISNNMAQPYDDGYICVVAIDFGTTYSGYAFSFKTDPKDVKTNRNWGANVGMETYKTPTCILFDENQKFVSFGFEAQQDYTDLENNKDKSFYFFELFKMELHSKRTLPKFLKDKTNKTMSTVTVFAKAIQFLQDHFNNAADNDSTMNIKPSEIRWIITVPAIWSFRSRIFMREAAVKAGLVDETQSKKLIIALEPESGSIFCRNLEVKQFASQCSKEKMQLDIGTRYVTLDCGGGTLDVTVHEVIKEGEVKELHFATGGAQGGAKVNEAFIDLMERVLGKEFIDYFKTESPKTWLKFILDFENKKRACRADTNVKLQITLPYQLGASYKIYTGNDIQDFFGTKSQKGVRLKNGVFVLANATVKALFEDVIRNIQTHVAKLISQIPNITYIFIVGGFSDSQLLQAAILEASGPTIRVMIPQEAVLAVVKGAVMFGHTPSLIRERKARHYYGIEVHGDYTSSGKYNTKYRNRDGDVPYFDKKLDKEAVLGAVEAGVYSPKYAHQTEVAINVYQLDDLPIPERIVYIKDAEDGNRFKPDLLGNMIAPMPGHGLDRKIRITLEFGGTVITVKAECNGEVKEGSVNCNLEYDD